MTERSPLTRAKRGAIEGAATGLVVAIVRLGIKLTDGDKASQIGQHIPEVAAFFVVSVIACSYVFAVGRWIANGVLGAILGTAVLVIVGMFAGYSLVHDLMGPPIPALVGSALGVVTGAPTGALVHRWLVGDRHNEKA